MNAIARSWIAPETGRPAQYKLPGTRTLQYRERNGTAQGKKNARTEQPEPPCRRCLRTRWSMASPRCRGTILTKNGRHLPLNWLSIRTWLSKELRAAVPRTVPGVARVEDGLAAYGHSQSKKRHDAAVRSLLMAMWLLASEWTKALHSAHWTTFSSCRILHGKLGASWCC
eukprot:COSAG06_NODE_26805_length_607_cov_0.751969_1_plen_169_part_10